MKNEELTAIIQQTMKDAIVNVSGDGYHYHLKIISQKFIGLNKLKRQQIVYQILHSYITSGELHALSIEACTPEEIL